MTLSITPEEAAIRKTIAQYFRALNHSHNGVRASLAYKDSRTHEVSHFESDVSNADLDRAHTH